MPVTRYAELHLEPVALRPRGRVVDLLERVRLERAVARGAVLHAGAQHEPRVQVAVARQRPAPPRPVRDVPAGDVARSDREIGAVLERRDQLGKHGGVMGQVGVDLHEDVIVPRRSRPRSRPGTRRRDPACSGAAAPRSGRARPPRLGHVRGAVRAVVVEHEDVRVGHGLAHAVEVLRDVRHLVVRRRADKNSRHDAPFPRRTD